MPPEQSDAEVHVKRVHATQTPEETQALARRLAPLLRPGDFLALIGELGGGKTCFVQGLAGGLGVQGRVSSPTFVLVHYHPGPIPLCHVDAYRIGPEELHELGVDEYARTGVVAVEWADRVAAAWPPDVLILNFTYSDTGRRLECTARGERSAALLEAWEAA